MYTFGVPTNPLATSDLYKLKQSEAGRKARVIGRTTNIFHSSQAIYFLSVFPTLFQQNISSLKIG